MLKLWALDDVWIRIDCDDSIAHELSEYFEFDVPGAQHMRRTLKHWTGKIRLFKLRTHTIYRGLVPRILEFAQARSYTVENHVPLPDPLWKEDDEMRLYLEAFKLPYTPHDFQYAALQTLLDKERGIVLSPTGSGKSFIIYLLTRLLASSKTLIVVPTIGLVTQLSKDFKSYGCEVGNELHLIYAGQAKDSDQRIFISTWQSIYELDPEWFMQFECIIVDEVHLAKAKSLVHLLEKATDTPYRFGFSGTLDDTLCHRLVLEGLFGDITKVTTTNTLQKQGTLAPLKVKLCVLEYPDTLKQQMARCNYQDEIDYLVQDPARSKFVAELCHSTKGNTLVLFQFIDKHGLQLFQDVRLRATLKSVHYVAGSVDGDEREAIRQHVSNTDDNVIVASYGTFSTGINIPNLRNIILAHPTKSKYRVLQSIGRSLRTYSGKTHATLIDIVDDLRWKSWENHTFHHAQERVKYYASEKFPVQMLKVPMSLLTVKHDA